MLHRSRLEGAQKAETRPFADYDPLRVHPILGSGWGGGGKTYRVNLGGGKRPAERALQNHFWRPQKLGLVWSVPLSFKGNDRESPKRRGETYRRWGV